MDHENHLIIEQKGALGIIVLNRVSSLNALTLDMINGIHQQIETWQDDTTIQAILIKSNSPKAFCAGGDIRYLYDHFKNGTAGHKGYFIAEYAMLNCIRASQKTVVVLLDGYVLGAVLAWLRHAILLSAVKNHVLRCPKQQLVSFQMSQPHISYHVWMILGCIWRLQVTRSRVAMPYI